MARIRDWIHGFLTEHAARYGPNDWPLPESEDWVSFVKGWVTQFNLKQVTEQEADRASTRLAGSPPNFRREHVPAVLGMVDVIRAEQGRTGQAVDMSSREAAEFASRDCNDCCGKTGLALRWHPQPDPARKIGPTFTGYCGCPLGRWVKRTHAQRTPELSRHFIDVTDEDSGNVAWLRWPPAEHTLGGYRFGTEKPRIYYEPVRLKAPSRWTDPPAKSAAPEPRDGHMKAAINAAFTRALEGNTPKLRPTGTDDGAF